MKNRNALATNTLEAHVKRYGSARVDLLIMIVLTVVNIVLMFFGSETMMLFSASIPYIAVGMGYWNADNEMLIFGIIVACLKHQVKEELSHATKTHKRDLGRTYRKGHPTARRCWF